MRIIIKGGVWKNTEDEILKAAVMKYGKNQWARISSLLTRKTPKQCKARWFEWLDPSIKKTEWSKEEDEKLLHLAKLMPTQWRTIAPIVGRTPAQCLERYQRLLDEAEAGEEGDRGPNSDDVRRLRPGEIDPEPETKPARPDPVDMDEDEKEMLSEARARLANTQGKKAKRKAREKQLEEARRLAMLQKRRELKAAGIDSNIKRKHKGMDYNTDIPFYKPQPAGFWDINDEVSRERTEKRDFDNELLSKFEGKRRVEAEELERKKDAKKQKLQKEKGDYVPPHVMRAIQAQAIEKTARGSLMLPAPQVSEAELETIVKIGTAGENVRAMVDANMEGFSGAAGSSGSSSSSALVSDYSTFRAPTPMRTPRSSAINGNQDSLKQQARNLKAMTMAQTPLLGEAIEIEGDIGDFTSITPKRTVVATPNPLAAHLTPRAANGSAATPSIAGTPRSVVTSGNLFSVGTGSAGARGDMMGGTPLHDHMGINSSTPRTDFGSVSGANSAFDATPRALRMQQELLRRQLNEHFASLPKPKNEFEIVIPDMDDEDVDTDKAGHASGAGDLMDEDAEDVMAREMRHRKREAEAKLKRRSQAVQRGLPRPVITTAHLEKMFKNDVSTTDGHADIDEMIAREKVLLLQRDAILYPSPGQPPLMPSATLGKLVPLSDDLLNEASQLIRAEFESELPAIQADDDDNNDGDNAVSTGSTKTKHAALLKRIAMDLVHGDKTVSDGNDTDADLDSIHTALASAHIFSPSSNTFIPTATQTPKDMIEIYASQLESHRTSMRQHANKAQSLEKRLGITLGGYMARSKTLARDLDAAVTALRTTQVNLAALATTKTREDSVLEDRVQVVRKELHELAGIESDLQMAYREKSLRRSELLAAWARAQA